MPVTIPAEQGSPLHSELPRINLQELRELCSSAPQGAFLELGVYKGGSAWELYQVAQERNCKLHLFDTFTGMPEQGPIDLVKKGAFSDCDLPGLRSKMPQAEFHVGYFPDTLPPDLNQLSFVHIDCDQHATCVAAIKELWPRMVPGGIMAFDDYPLPGIRQAINDRFLGNLQFTASRIPYVVKSENMIMNDTLPKYVMSNLVYGATYANLFLTQHLRSLLDPSNLPALKGKYAMEYMLFTDQETLPMITAHPNFVKLSELADVSFCKFEWPDGINRFDHRYGALQQMFHSSAEHALKENAWLTAWVADLVVAKDFFPRIMKRMEAGHGAVLMLPPRSAADVMVTLMAQVEGALPDHELFKLCYENMHPLWSACHWDSPQFSKLPFCLLWNSGTGLLAHSYSVTPIIFKPTPEMLTTPGVIDRIIPSLCKDPYWCTDWTDAPVIGVEPLFCYYPPFTNMGSSSWQMAKWTKDNIDPTQLQWLSKEFYYPDRNTAYLDKTVETHAHIAVTNILKLVEAK